MRKDLSKSPRVDIKVLNPKKAKPDWKLLFDSENIKIDRLLEVYKENPSHARIIFTQGGRNNYQKNRVVAYTYENGDINIVNFTKTYGISITNKKYESEKNQNSIIYKKDTNSWYFKSGGIKLLTYNLLMVFIQQSDTNFNYSQPRINFNHGFIFQYMETKLPWLRNLKEDTRRYSHNVSFNTIITKKLFNVKSIYRHLFGIPYPKIEIILKGIKNNYEPKYFIPIWKEMAKVLINVENLDENLFNHPYFIDTCKMASSLNKKINCSWGIPRFISEHDKWSKEITNVLLLNEKLSKLHINDVFREFSAFSDYKLLETNYDMIEDGLVMKHCVATYIDRVNSGVCGIYKVDGYTMELRVFNSKHINKELNYVQIKGVNNCEPPNELKTLIKEVLTSFNNEIMPDYNYNMLTNITTNSTKLGHLQVFPF
jgi:hypothetical protein|tara:strand:- start:3705 stop:4985 length:1281 start_codon:yes stop_codon:yes gene_type:complete